MIYLLDACVLITANNSYYPIDRVPEFWDWLLYQANSGDVKIPIEIIKEEILIGSKEPDLLESWMKINRKSFELDEEVDSALLRRIVNKGYASDLTEDEVEVVGKDPFLVAYALAAVNRFVVTTEVSAPKKTRQNRHLPDVCQTFSVPCLNTFEFTQALDFRTAWKESN